MVGALGSAHVLHRDVGHDLMHGIEQLVARFLAAAGFVDPQAAEFLLDGRPHVAEEGTGRGSVVAHAHTVVGAHGVPRYGRHPRHGMELIGRCRCRHPAVELVGHARVHVHGRQTVVHLVRVVLGQSREEDVPAGAHRCRHGREHVVLRRHRVVLRRLRHLHVASQEEIPRRVRRVLVLVRVAVAGHGLSEVGRRVGVGTERVEAAHRLTAHRTGSGRLVVVVVVVVFRRTEIETIVKVLVVVVDGGHVRGTHQKRRLVPLVETVIHH